MDKSKAIDRNPDEPPSMVSRLGFVIYWTGCALAVLFVILALIVAFNGENTNKWVIGTVLAIAAVTSCVAGRAAKYILSGK